MSSNNQSTMYPGWYALAYAIECGNKQEAYALYNLITRDIEDRAYCDLLRAQIAMALHDSAGLASYYQLGQHYRKQQLYKQAIGIYEQVRLLDPFPVQALTELITLYALAQDYSSLQKCIEGMIDLFEQRRARQDQLQRLVAELAPILTASQQQDRLHALKAQLGKYVPIR